jgi:hypothetical protein
VAKNITVGTKKALPLGKAVVESTSYLLPLASEASFTEWYANPRGHQLSSVCLVVPFWLAVKQELEI